MKLKDYYTILGVERTADRDEIRKAFHRLAFELHPDRNSEDPEAPAKLRLAIEAWEVLGDHRRRARYDLETAPGGRDGGERSRATGTDFGGVRSGGFDSRTAGDSAAWRQRAHWAGPGDGNGNGNGRSRTSGGRKDEGAGDGVRQQAKPERTAPKGPQLGRRFVGIRKARVRLGDDDLYHMHLSRQEAASGLIVKLEIPSGAFRPKTLPCSVCRGKGNLFQAHKKVRVHVPCSFCQGRGYFTIKPKPEDDEIIPMTVSIPAGVHDGAKLTVPGTTHGDLNLILRIDQAETRPDRSLDLDSLISN